METDLFLTYLPKIVLSLQDHFRYFYNDIYEKVKDYIFLLEKDKKEFLKNFFKEEIKEKYIFLCLQINNCFNYLIVSNFDIIEEVFEKKQFSLEEIKSFCIFLHFSNEEYIIENYSKISVLINIYYKKILMKNNIPFLENTWTFDNHKYFPKDLKKKIFTFLMINEEIRKKNKLLKVPKYLYKIIFSNIY